MEDDRKQPKRGTLESFFTSVSVKKQKAHCQSTSINGDSLQQSIDDNTLPSSTSEAPTLLVMTDDGSLPQSESIEVLSFSSIQQPESTAPSMASQISVIPIDISRSGTDNPVQPKLSSFKKK